ncbi:MAG: monophosphatase [Actinomycetota bacterium]|nr:monophosphatase [Actinomycetota bacterium]
MPSPSPLDDLVALAVSVAEEAGRLLLDGLARDRVVVETKTTGTDMVTEMDRASEALIVGRLRAARPFDGVVGEEGADHRGTSGVDWIIDPLDGTTNYLYGFLSFGVSVAAAVDGVVSVGAVCDPVHGETFSAVLGGGAFVNGRPLPRLAAGLPPTLATALIGTGFSYSSARRAEQAVMLARVLPAVRDIRRAGAAALDLCWVGAGRLDGFFEHGLQPWDWATGGLVALEAGARAEVVEGDLHVAAPAHLFDDLVSLVNGRG